MIQVNADVTLTEIGEISSKIGQVTFFTSFPSAVKKRIPAGGGTSSTVIDILLVKRPEGVSAVMR